MTSATQIRPARYTSGNLARLDLENLDRFGVYPRIFFEDRSYTNLEEIRHAGSLAQLLKENGVRTDDRIVVMMPNSPDTVAAFPAIWTIGATIVPVIPQWTAAEVAEVFRNSEASVALTVPALASRLREAGNLAGSLKRLLVFGEPGIEGATNISPLLAGLPPIESPIDRAAEDMAVLLYTSGTTGTPKGVMISHGNFLNALASALEFNPAIGLGPALLSLPLTHVYGILMQNLANAWGISSVMLRQFDPTRVLEAIERYRVRYMPVVPTMLVYLLNHPERIRFDTSSLYRITAGGAALPEKVRLDFEQAFPGCRVQQGYGLSESASVATTFQLDEVSRPGSAGRALPGVELRILDDQEQPLPARSAGEICISGLNVTSGYFRDAAATRKTLSGGWLHTGDIGYLDEDGYLFITDRKKDLIIKGGENISPREIEEALYLHPAVAEAAVVGIPHPVFGEDLCAVVQLKPGKDASADEIRQHVGKYVTKFKIPGQVVFHPSLPKNSTGKILKREIRAQLAKRPAEETK